MGELSPAVEAMPQASGGAAERRRLAWKLSGTVHDPLPVNHPVPVLQFVPRSVDRRPPALSREPCPRCAARGDLGCAHQRPYEPPPPPAPRAIAMEPEPDPSGAGTRPHAWSADEDAQLITMIAEGVSVRQIAARVGRANGSVYNRLKILARKGRLDPAILPRNNRSPRP